MILVAGCAGFIGHALCVRLLEMGELIIGMDNLNDYYDKGLKLARLSQLQANNNFYFQLGDITKQSEVDAVMNFQPKTVINLAAQAGVRHSLDKPQDYVDSNITGLLNILNACRDNKVEKLIYASSSSVYGINNNPKSSPKDRTDSPANFYAVSKKCNELMAHAYHHLYGVQSVGLRFFTVYGPWGRPDMAMYKFTKALLAGEPLDVYNNGNHRRSFTYIDDIVDGIIASMKIEGLAIHNIGGESAVNLMDLIQLLEKETGTTAKFNMMDMQQGDVMGTFAEKSAIPGYSPKVGIEEGVKRFVKWYRSYHQ